MFKGDRRLEQSFVVEQAGGLLVALEYFFFLFSETEAEIATVILHIANHDLLWEIYPSLWRDRKPAYLCLFLEHFPRAWTVLVLVTLNVLDKEYVGSPQNLVLHLLTLTLCDATFRRIFRITELKSHHEIAGSV